MPIPQGQANSSNFKATVDQKLRYAAIAPASNRIKLVSGLMNRLGPIGETDGRTAVALSERYNTSLNVSAEPSNDIKGDSQ